MPNVFCYNIKNLCNSIEAISNQNNGYILISSFSFDCEDIKNASFPDGKTLKFNFADDTNGECCIHIEDAKSILDFAELILTKYKGDLYIACDGGVSRSAALVGFIELFVLDKEENTIFSNSFKSPNDRVLTTMLAAYCARNLNEGNVNLDRKIDKLFRLKEHNEELFFNRIKNEEY